MPPDETSLPVSLRATQEGVLCVERVCVHAGSLNNDFRVLREDLTLFRHSVSPRFPSQEGPWLSLQTVCVG